MFLQLGVLRCLQSTARFATSGFFLPTHHSCSLTVVWEFSLSGIFLLRSMIKSLKKLLNVHPAGSELKGTVCVGFICFQPVTIVLLTWVQPKEAEVYGQIYPSKMQGVDSKLTKAGGKSRDPWSGSCKLCTSVLPCLLSLLFLSPEQIPSEAWHCSVSYSTAQSSCCARTNLPPEKQWGPGQLSQGQLRKLPCIADSSWVSMHSPSLPAGWAQVLIFLLHIVPEQDATGSIMISIAGTILEVFSLNYLKHLWH